MKHKTRIFYDFEATSVAIDADAISVGLVAVTTTDYYLTGGKRVIDIKTFYAEFTDFNTDKCDDWVKENIVSKLYLESSKINVDNNIVKGDAANIKNHLTAWLSQFEEIEFWADFDVIDKPMLIYLIADWNYSNPCGFISKKALHFEESKKAYVCDKCGEARGEDCRYMLGLPIHLPNVKYDQFFDLHTMFKIKGIDTDIDREEFALIDEYNVRINLKGFGTKHNALYDAYIAYLCYCKLDKGASKKKYTQS